MTAEQLLKYKFGNALHEALMASLRASQAEISFGHPCREMIGRAMQIGMQAFVGEILDFSGQTELRLNGAGLKMYLSRHGDELSVMIGGDQYKEYPVTGPVLSEIFRRHGFPD